MTYNKLTAFQIYEIEPLFHSTILGLSPYIIIPYHHLINGFWGQADNFGNMDGINSAEEAFNYTESNIWDEQHPTILDLYPGEFPVTYS